MPPDWHVEESPGSWTALDQFGPGSGVPGEETVAPLDFSAFMVVNSMPLPSGMSDADWLSAFNALVTAGLPESCPAATTQRDVGGEQATVITEECDGYVIVGRSLVHSGRGYYFTTRASTTNSDDQTTLQTIVDSIAFPE